MRTLIVCIVALVWCAGCAKEAPADPAADSFLKGKIKFTDYADPLFQKHNPAAADNRSRDPARPEQTE